MADTQKPSIYVEESEQAVRISGKGADGFLNVFQIERDDFYFRVKQHAYRQFGSEIMEAHATDADWWMQRKWDVALALWSAA